MKINEILEKYGDIELKDEEVEELIKKYKKNKAWKPGYQDAYYFIQHARKQAEFALEKQKVYTELKRYAQEHNEEKIDWHNSQQFKFYLTYNHVGWFTIGVAVRSSRWSQVYFTSEEIAQNAIEEIGEDRIKKYLFEVEE